MNVYLKFFIYLLVFGVLGVVFLWAMLRRGAKNHPNWGSLRRWRYAHRGLYGDGVPENSMEAFRLALEGGYGAELDIHLLADGEVAVIHDASLQRTANADVKIEELTEEDLQQYTLEGTEEHIPLLKDVLELFDGKAPLIVELKPVGNNHEKLCSAAMEHLAEYDGLYCVESFDPRVVQWFKTNAPDICRGQLAEDFKKSGSGKLTPFLRFCLTHLLANSMGRPHFVAYRFEDRSMWSVVLHRLFHRTNRVWWTVTDEAGLAFAERKKGIAIFERFRP